MASSTGSSTVSVDPELIIAHKIPETTFTYTERDVAIYALGVGAWIGHALDEKELKYVYHKTGQPFVKALPTYSTIIALDAAAKFQDVPGLQFDPKLVLHGEQYVEIYRPLPSNACIQNRTVLAGLHDKGKATVVEIETTSYEKGSGEALCKSRMTYYLRGAGGFSKSATPYTYSNYPADQVLPVKVPKGQPFKVYEDCTQQSQALLYRLSGDFYLHSDPLFMKVEGFPRPILHGLCTLGFAIRAIIKCVCNGEPTMVRGIYGRFLLHVYPGETLVTEMWLEGSRVIYQTKVKERNRAVVRGYVILNRATSSM